MEHTSVQELLAFGLSEFRVIVHVVKFNAFLGLLAQLGRLVYDPLDANTASTAAYAADAAIIS